MIPVGKKGSRKVVLEGESRGAKGTKNSGRRQQESLFGKTGEEGSVVKGIPES